MAEKIFDEFGMTFDILLVPGEKGVYDVTVEGDRIYSKHETGRRAIPEIYESETRSDAETQIDDFVTDYGDTSSTKRSRRRSASTSSAAPHK